MPGVLKPYSVIPTVWVHRKKTGGARFLHPSRLEKSIGTQRDQ